jgi:hypothetical protein
MFKVDALLLLLFNIVATLHSSCSKLLLFFLLEVITLFLLFYSSFLTCYSTCFARPPTLFFLLEVVILFLLLNMLFYSFFLTYYSTCLARPATLFLLLDVVAFLVRCRWPFCSMLLFYSFCSMLLLLLLNVVVFCSLRYLSTIPLILLLFVPLCFKLVFPPFILHVQRNIERRY